jgi:hypothetical protein
MNAANVVAGTLKIGRWLLALLLLIWSLSS